MGSSKTFFRGFLAGDILNSTYSNLYLNSEDLLSLVGVGRRAIKFAALVSVQLHWTLKCENKIGYKLVSNG